jgi:uncharacterized protein (UPF0335 family)
MSADTQIKAIFDRWERLEGEKKAISDDLKELFSEAKHAGYDGKALRAAFNRKVKQDAATPEDAHFDAVVDVYLDALNGVARDARMHARENIGEFDPETGEFRNDGDRFGTVKHMREQIELARNERATSSRTPGAEPTGVTVVGTESGTVSNPVANVEEEATGAIAAASNDPASRTDEGGERQHSSTVGFADDCRTGGKEQSAAAAAPVGDAAADAHGIPEPDQPLTGGDHVALNPHAATRQAGGLVQKPPAKPLRPHCLRPENCGGYGSNHCFSCKKAATAGEVAA